MVRVMNGGFGMSSKGGGMRWFEHLERMAETEMTGRIYNSGIDAGGVRGRPTVN